MNLKDLLPKNLPFLKGENPPQDYYFALNISSSIVTASIWGIENKNLKIVNTLSASYSSEEDMIEKANSVMDQALGSFTPEPKDILFGVPDAWLQDDNLKEGYLNFLKKLVKELDVIPLAYVSTTHAITHLLQKQFGVPSTTILVETIDPMNLSVIKGGKILGSKSLKRGEDLPLDIQKVLASFTSIEVLPSKISLFDPAGKSLEKYKDELTNFNWMSELPFLHLPKVEILDSEVAIRAVSLAGASEIEPNIAYNEKSLDHIETPTFQSPVTKGDNLAPVTDERAGFVAGDIEDEEKEAQELAVRESSAPDSYHERVVEQPISVNTALGKLKHTLMLPLNFLESKGIKIPSKLNRLPGGKVTIVPLCLVVVLLLGFIFFSRAKVTVFIDPKVLEKDAQVIADPKVTTVDENQKIIPGKIVETDVTGADKGSASGKKQVGDPSRGTVTIRDKSSSSISFSQGTVLLGPNGLKFTLDSSTPNIASPSADTGAWGTATGINVTASQIGPDSNLPANTIMSISGQASSDFDAKVETGLSGGTSKDVTVVTADDQKKLLATVASELRQKAQSQLQAKLSGDEKILPEALDESIIKSIYSKNVGDEATEFTLNLSAHYRGTAYSDNDLKLMVSKLVQTNVPDGYELNLSDTQTQADVSKLQSDGKLIFLARFKANLLPKLNLDDIKGKIKGKTPSDATLILQGIDNVVKEDIILIPNLPGPFQRLPFIPQNINLVESAQ